MATARAVFETAGYGKARKQSVQDGSWPPIHFDVWGCRGSRSLFPRRSNVGNATSCYSVLCGQDLFVFDAGRGLALLSHALGSQGRFQEVKRLHVLITHAHMDHWEGLKDADWFWDKGNGLEVCISAPAEALGAILSGYGHPSYVPLGLLSAGTLAHLEYRTVGSGQRRRISGWTVRTGPLNHYSGEGEGIQLLDTVGYRLSSKSGPTVVYMCDHEPTAKTARSEARLLEGAHLALLDAHFPDIRDHRYGHGSQEHAAHLAKDRPDTLILAGHHGPTLTDPQIRAASRRHGRGVTNFHVATEGRTYLWDARRKAFVLQLRSTP